MCSGYREIVAPWPVPNRTSKKDLVHFYDLVTLDVCLQQFFTQPEQDLAVSCGKMAKSGIRAVFRVKRHTATAPLRHRLNVKPIAQLYREKNLLLYSGVLRAFQAHCFLHFFTIFANNIEHRTSHGQVTRLLQVPFLRGPSGRKSIQFVGAILWNMLPPLARSIHDLHLFKQFISTFDLTAVEIISNIPMFNLL